MENIMITGDSTCDLSQELKERYLIETVPLYVNFGEESRRDGVDVQPDDIYAYYDHNGKLPTTSATTPADYMEFFSRKAREGDAVIHFNISSGFSAAYNNACLAAKEFSNVYVVDSKNLSTGTALLMLRACDLAKEGVAAAKIAEEMGRLRDKVRASFIIDKLEYLWKGGRCSGVTALGANLLRLKPCIEVEDGNMKVGKKFRGKLGDVLEEYVENRLKGRADLALDRIFITHAGIAQEHIDRVRRKVEEFADFGEILVTRAGCTISNHCGPNTLGILFITK